VHVDAGALAGGEGTAELEDGPALPIEVARRLACDARIEVVAEGAGSPDLGLTFVKPNGQPLRHGPPEMREELRERWGVSWGFAAVAPLLSIR
jgi:hypothetical protein